MSEIKQSISAYRRYKETQSESTAREYCRYINYFIEYLNKETDTDPWNCDSGHIEGYFEKMLQDGYAPSSVRIANAGISDFYEQITNYGRDGRRGFPKVSIDRDPSDDATPERINGMEKESKKEIKDGDRPLNSEEVAELINSVSAPTVRNKLICKILYQTGIRRSELERIKLADIDFEERKIHITDVKTGGTRKVWYQPNLSSLLEMWVEADRPAVFYAEESEYLFPTRRGVRMKEQTVSDIVSQAAENADLQEDIYKTKRPTTAKEDDKTPTIKRVTAHTLRKSFGVHFINSGGDISLLSDLLGHESIETTKESYLKYSDEDLKKSARQHGPSV
jgi:integrase/recombinase XerD